VKRIIKTVCPRAVIVAVLLSVNYSIPSVSFAWPDEQADEIEEIVVRGIQPHSFEDYFTITMYSVPDGWGIDAFVQQISDMLDDINQVLEEAGYDQQADCEQQQSEFRTSCLDLAHNANNGCLATATMAGGVMTSITTPGGGLGVGVLGLMYCNDLYYQATNNCNSAADNYSWPEAPAYCQ